VSPFYDIQVLDLEDADGLGTSAVWSWVQTFVAKVLYHVRALQAHDLGCVEHYVCEGVKGREPEKAPGLGGQGATA
jgi:hypothetical protein